MVKLPVDPELPPAPDACTIVENAGTFRIDTAFTPCAICNPSGGAQWDGLFKEFPGLNCEWVVDPNAGTGILTKGVHTGWGWSRIWLDAVTPAWRVKVSCTWRGMLGQTVWQGFKVTGPDAAGVYQRDAGCDVTDFRSIVRVT